MSDHDTDHKKVWGAGFHAGKKAAGNAPKIEYVPRYAMPTGVDLSNRMILWAPKWLRGGDAKAVLCRWPGGHDPRYVGWCSWGACDVDVQKADFDTRKRLLFLQIAAILIGDGVDPDSLHRALLPLDEYRHGLPGDMPGLRAWDSLTDGG